MKNDLLKWILGIVQALILLGITSIASVVWAINAKLETTAANQSHITANQARMGQNIDAVRAEVGIVRSDVAVLGERIASYEARIRRLEDK